jgi:hypothetical protein
MGAFYSAFAVVSPIGLSRRDQAYRGFAKKKAKTLPLMTRITLICTDELFFKFKKSALSRI